MDWRIQKVNRYLQQLWGDSRQGLVSLEVERSVNKPIASKAVPEALRSTILHSQTLLSLSRRRFIVFGITAGLASFCKTFAENNFTNPGTMPSIVSHILNGEEDGLGLDLEEILRSVDSAKSPFKARLLRTEDLLSIDLEFVNLSLIPAKRNRNIFQIIFGLKRTRRFYLAKRDNNANALLIAHFPPQHIAEESFFEATEHGDKVYPPPVRSILAGPSRLVFQIPKTVERIAYDVPTLLDWAKYSLMVPPVALPRDESTEAVIREPNPFETSIELPYRLILSPNRHATWIHSNSPVGREQIQQGPGGQPDTKKRVVWTELWHTRLGVRLGDSETNEFNNYYKTVRAVWLRDQGGPNPKPDECLPARKPPEFSNKREADACERSGDFLRSMTAQDRNEIVQLTSNFKDLKTGPANAKVKYDPLPVEIEKLFLTSLGATISSQVSWPIVYGKDDAEFNISDWREETSIGRDQYVRIVYRGFLYPFGHPCTLVQVTYRKFQNPDICDRSTIGAYLRQKITIAIRDPRRELGNTGIDNGEADRQIPFTSMDCLTLETPPLEPPECWRVFPFPQAENCEPKAIPRPEDAGKVCAFWPVVGKTKFLFHLAACDHAGKTSECVSPAIFVVHSKAHDESVMKAVEKAWKDSHEGRRQMNGQEIAFAPSQEAGDTTFETISLDFGARRASGPSVQLRADSNLIASLRLTAEMLSPQDSCQLPPKEPPAPWTPVADGAEVKVPSVENLAGNNKSTEIEYFPGYTKKGFEGNPGEVFAKLKERAGSNPFNHELPDSRSLGLVLPPLDIRGFSRRFGAVSSRPKLPGDQSDPLEGFNNGNYDPKELLKGLKAKILGVFDLQDLLTSLIGFNKSDSDRVPSITTRVINDSRGIPEILQASLTWLPKLSDGQKKGFVSFQWNADRNLSMSVISETRLRENGKSMVKLYAVMENFSIRIADTINLVFKKMEFTVRPGQKPDVKVDISGAGFEQALEFVNAFQQYLASKNGKNGPMILLTPQSVTASMGFKLPTIGVGVFSLQNVRLSARFVLPFKGDKPMTLRFAFGERNNTFLISGAIFGGGGFLALSFSLKGIELLELALEFGGVVAIGVGIAEGNAYVLGGIYIEYRPSVGATLTGYVRCGGSLTVWGFITVAIELYHGLAYDIPSGAVYGEAMVTVTISVGFLSKDVEFKVRHEFVKGNQGQLNAGFAPSFGGGSDHMLVADGATTIEAPQDTCPLRPFTEQVTRSDWNSYWNAFAV